MISIAKMLVKSFIKVVLYFVLLIVILFGALVGNTKLAEYRANSFCEAAVQKNNVNEVMVLLADTKGVGHYYFLGRGAGVNFSAYPIGRYSCSISFDEHGQPESQNVRLLD